MARPLIKIDYKLVEAMGVFNSTIEEISSQLGVSVATLRRRKKFWEAYEKGRAAGCVSIRRAQHRRAVVEGSDRMLIHLGINRLGQTSKSEKPVGDEVAPPTKFVFEVKPAVAEVKVTNAKAE